MVKNKKIDFSGSENDQHLCAEEVLDYKEWNSDGSTHSITYNEHAI